jgi:hypothetical protein
MTGMVYLWCLKKGESNSIVICIGEDEGEKWNQSVLCVESKSRRGENAWRKGHT